MIRRSTLIVLVVFLVLLGFVLYWQNWGQEASADDALSAVPTLAPKAAIFDLPEEAFVVGVRIESADGNLVEVSRDDAESAWVLLQPSHQEDTDSQQIQLMADQLVTLRESSSLETSLSLGVTGLESPVYTITLKLDDGQQENLFVGDVTITGSSYYVRVDDGSPQVVSKYSLDAALNMLETLPLLPTPMPELES
ncbi:MAG: DUF4340 domain-containing protein [Chloroflexota bacterium]|nr:DUF4340 domain-containing protein [Chloroflexota bacterium]